MVFKRLISEKLIDLRQGSLLIGSYIHLFSYLSSKFSSPSALSSNHLDLLKSKNKNKQKTAGTKETNRASKTQFLRQGMPNTATLWRAAHFPVIRWGRTACSLRCLAYFTSLAASASARRRFCEMRQMRKCGYRVLCQHRLERKWSPPNPNFRWRANSRRQSFIAAPSSKDAAVRVLQDSCQLVEI